jgi:hypothetical protein
MIKGFLNVEEETKRISRKQCNSEIKESVNRIEKGNFISHKNALKELPKW